MSGIYQILNTAKDAFLASQISMEVTGSNVANASTPGYVRQRAVLAAKSPGEVAGNATQSGVEITTIERLYDRFIEFQMVDQSSQVGDASIRKETFDRIEAIFNETDGGGLNDLLNQFWTAWEDLSANPTGQVERTALANAADSLATMFREYAGELYSIQTDLNVQIEASVTQLNGYLSDLADLNDKIVQGYSGGVNVNNLLDQRSELLKKTAGLIDIQYVEETGGAVNVFTADGRALVQGNSSWQLAVRDNGAGLLRRRVRRQPDRSHQRCHRRREALGDARHEGHDRGGLPDRARRSRRNADQHRERPARLGLRQLPERGRELLRAPRLHGGPGHAGGRRHPGRSESNRRGGDRQCRRRQRPGDHAASRTRSS